MDGSFKSRFWTQFEAWLSFQIVTSAGLHSRKAGDKARNHILTLHNANEGDKQALVEMWSDTTPEQAWEKLSKPDVQVTNQKDKEIQLGKLGKLSDEVMEQLGKLSEDERRRLDSEDERRRLEVLTEAEAEDAPQARKGSLRRESLSRAATQDLVQELEERSSKTKLMSLSRLLSFGSLLPVGSSSKREEVRC